MGIVPTSVNQHTPTQGDTTTNRFCNNLREKIETTIEAQKGVETLVSPFFGMARTTRSRGQTFAND